MPDSHAAPRPRVVRASLLSMIGLVALGATRLIHGALVVRATDSATYAVVGTLIGLAMTASLFLPGGLASAASRFIPFYRGAGDEAGARTAYRVLTAAGYGCAVLLGVIVALASTTLTGVTTGNAVAVGLLTTVYSGYSVAKSSLYGFDRVVPYAWLEIAGSVVAIAATAIVVASGASDYLLPLTIGYAVLMLGALFLLRSRTRTGRSSIDRREVTSYVWLASIGGLASAGLLQALPALAGRFSTADGVSFVVAAVTLVAPLFFLPRALGMALFPAMARAQGAGDTEVVRRHLDVSTRALFVLLAPLFAAGIALAPVVLSLFGGSRLADGDGVLRVLLVATYLGSVQVAAINSLSSGSAFRIPAWSAVAGAVVGLAVLFPFGLWWGAVGVTGCYLVAVAITTAVPLAVAWRRFDLAWTGMIVRSLVVVAVALIAAGVVAPLGLVADVLTALVLAAAGVALLRRDITGVLAARRS